MILRGVSWWHTCHSRKKSNDVDCQGGDFGSLFCRNTTLIIINPFDKNNTMVSMTTTCSMLGGGFWGDCKGGTPCRYATILNTTSHLWCRADLKLCSEYTILRYHDKLCSPQAISVTLTTTDALTTIRGSMWLIVF